MLSLLIPVDASEEAGSLKSVLDQDWSRSLVDSDALSTIALIVSIGIIAIQTLILWKQTQIVTAQARLGAGVDLSVELLTEHAAVIDDLSISKHP